MYSKILVGFDGSEGSRLALVTGAKLATQYKAEIHALWVRGSLPHYPGTIDEIEEEKFAANGYAKNLETQTNEIGKQENIPIQFVVKSGNPSLTLVKYAQENKIDLIILGHVGHSGLWGSLLGHTADKVSDHAPCSVLIVR